MTLIEVKPKRTDDEQKQIDAAVKKSTDPLAVLNRQLDRDAGRK